MSLNALWTWLEETALAQHIGISYWFPLLESIHVLALTLIVGSILTVDLRLLGLSALRYPAWVIIRELTPWTWGALVVAIVTGAGLFMTRASHYADNPAFRIKIAMLLLAAVNMAWFHRRTARDMELWDSAKIPPAAARLAGGLSLLLWSAAVLAGRWTGHLN